VQSRHRPSLQKEEERADGILFYLRWEFCCEQSCKLLSGNIYAGRCIILSKEIGYIQYIGWSTTDRVLLTILRENTSMNM